MDRQEALESIRENVANEHLVRHMLATEAIMRALARRLGGEEEEWGLAGLLHDIDVELTEGNMATHSQLGADMARDLGASETIANAILCHNEQHGVKPETLMEKALFCADPLTGLITAAVLVRPDKKIESLEANSVRKRFKEKSFAAGASREQISRCSEIGLELEDFITLGVAAMKEIAPALGF
ncbi:MAG: HD domain-containing protein [Dehalococcoidales bacterium]|jgi:putative nucleotidyltransferase with HDIG domain